MKKMFRLIALVLTTGFMIAYLIPLLSVSAEANQSHFYQQLSSKEKYLFVYLKNAFVHSASIPAELGIPLQEPLRSGEYDTLPNEQQGMQIVSAMMDTLLPSLQAALDALLADCPSVFFLDLTSDSPGDPSCGFTVSAESSRNEQGKYILAIDTVIMKVVIKEAYQNNRSAWVNKLSNHIKEFKPGGSNRYTRLISIHNYVCSLADYDRNFNDPMAYDALSVFEAGRKSVCEAYSKAIKLLCDEAGIPCLLVTGNSFSSPHASPERHMWNLVQMEDNHWYAVDATWNDQASGVQNDFFLVGSSSLPSASFSQMAFSASHVQDGDLSGTNSKIFNYPVMKATAYTLFNGMSLKKAPNKRTYTTEDKALHTKGLQLELTYDNNTTSVITSGFTVDFIDFSTVGKKVVTVRYGDFSTTFTITVTDPPPPVDRSL